MPYDDPEPDDPHELVGVELPGDESVTREMAAAFADEFAQLGFTRPQILALYRKAEYAGAHQAWRLLGQDEIARIVDESLAVWGRFSCVVTDGVVDDAAPSARAEQARPLRFFKSVMRASTLGPSLLGPRRERPMSTVKNWQLGREMDYPYDARHPDRQFAFVFNINRCIACQSCTMACKSTWTFNKGQEHMWWANVETKPYGGYPQWWDAKILEKLEEANPGGQVWADKPADARVAPYGRFDGQTVFEAAARTLTPDSARVLGYLPTDEEWNSPNIYEDNPVGKKGVRNRLDETGEQLPVHNTWFFYLARICNHCSYPACLAACPRQAIYKRPEDGIVLLDQSQCRGYRKCVEACPYKKSMYRGNTRTSEKCIACYPRVEGSDPETGGEPMETRCMAACIGQIRMQGLVKIAEDGTWAEDRQHPLYFLVHVAKVALPLYPQFGTQPNGYYIPPRWVPRPYLRQMFGPGVDRAIENYAAPSRELVAVLQLFRRSNRIIFRYEINDGPKIYEGALHGRKVEIFNDTVIAFGADGRELFRTTVEEPVHVRPAAHANSI